MEEKRERKNIASTGAYSITANECKIIQEHRTHTHTLQHRIYEFNQVVDLHVAKSEFNSSNAIIIFSSFSLLFYD